MAHKVACYRKKCIKSANCFRDREELSSLYTISSHSTSSVHSNEVLTQTNRQNSYQNKTFIKEETYNGDSSRKSPYAPPICTCNMRNGVHQNSCSCYHDYYDQDYNERTPPYLKNKIDSLPVDTCECVRQCYANSCCPVHQYTKPKYRTNLKNLEECYWAKWKPSKFECTQRRRGCCECDCPKLRAARTQDKSVEVIREPGAFENTSSNENATLQPSTKDLYKKVLNEYNNQISDPTPLINPHPELSVRFKNQDRVLEFDADKIHNRKLYNELYEEYENEFMRKVEENEQRKSEYYQELYNDMYNEYENELLSRMPSDQTETTETMPVETDSMQAETENTVETDTTEEKTDSITVLHKPGGNQRNEDDKIQEEAEEEEKETEKNPNPKVAKDLKISPPESQVTNTRKSEEQVIGSQQKIIRPPSFATEHLPVKGHTYPLKSVSKKQSQEKNRSKTGIIRSRSPGSMNYLPAYLQRIATNKTVGIKAEVKENVPVPEVKPAEVKENVPLPEVKPEVFGTSPPESSNNNSRRPEGQVDTSQQKIIKPPSFVDELPAKGHSYPLKSTPKRQSQDKTINRITRAGSPGSRNFVPSYLQRTARPEEQVDASQLKIIPNLENENNKLPEEETEKKEEQVDVSQQKIMKPPSFVGELPAKGHTYPLKSTSKSQSQDKTISSITRAGSPGSRNFVPSYLQRTARPEEQVDTPQLQIIPHPINENNKLPEEEKEKMEEENPKSEVMTSDKQNTKPSPAEAYISNRREPKQQVDITSPQKIIKPPSLVDELPAKGHTYPLKHMVKRQPQDKTKNRITQGGSPGGKNYMPSYLQRTTTKK